MTKIYPTCSLCNTVPELGLYDGLYLGRGFICTTCEQRMLKTTPENEEYEWFIREIRVLNLSLSNEYLEKKFR